MDAQYDKFVAAGNGTYTVNDTTQVTNKDFNGIYFAEDSVIANLYVNDGGSDIKANYISTPATAVKAGTIITTTGDDHFSAIQLTSGSVTLILR